MATIKNNNASTPGLGALSQPENNRSSGTSSKAKVPVIEEGDILDSSCHSVASSKAKNDPKPAPGIMASLFSLLTPKKDAPPVRIEKGFPPRDFNGADPSPRVIGDIKDLAKALKERGYPGNLKEIEKFLKEGPHKNAFPPPRATLDNGADPSPRIIGDIKDLAKALKEYGYSGDIKEIEKFLKDGPPRNKDNGAYPMPIATPDRPPRNKDNGAYPMPIATPDRPPRNKDNGAYPMPIATPDRPPRNKDNGAYPMPIATPDRPPRNKDNGAYPMPIATPDRPPRNKDNGAYPMPIATPDRPPRNKDNGAYPMPIATPDRPPRNKDNGAYPMPIATPDRPPRNKDNGADPSPRVIADPKALKKGPHKGPITPVDYIPSRNDLEKAMKDIEKGVMDLGRGIPPLINEDETEEVPKKAKQTISKKKE